MKIFRKLYYNIKYFIQRGKRGYSDFDIMDLDTYLLELITNSLKHLNNKKDGYPAIMSEDEWNSILQEMIDCFEKANPSTTDFEKLYKTVEKEKEEYLQKNLEQGFKLLVKYFHYLWY